MTGSNMSSNILFAGFQSTTANLLEVHSAIVLGAQSSGASIGSALSPSNIVLGTTTANILGSEGKGAQKDYCDYCSGSVDDWCICTGADQPVEEDENGRERNFF